MTARNKAEALRSLQTRHRGSWGHGVLIFSAAGSKAQAPLESSVVMIIVCLETFPSEMGLGERVIKSYALLKV